MGPCGLSQGEGSGGGRAEADLSAAYSPERNPVERVFAEVRRWVEGRRYERIEAKKAAVEEVPRRLEAEGKVLSLVGWHYIRQALNALPS
jgi:MoxR-like ATPase